MHKIFIGFLLLSIPTFLSAQSIDHWETAVNSYDSWKYQVGSSEPPSNWMNEDFDDTSWAMGTGGFGYGDGDDLTQIPATMSVYLRREFEIPDISLLEYAVLHADYDDAYVAYINGVEVARSNIGVQGIPPTHNQSAAGFHEASLYQGLIPDAFVLNKQQLQTLFHEGSNTLAFQVHNENIGSSDLSSNFFLSFALNNESVVFGNTPPWFSSPVFSTSLPLIVINTISAPEIYDEPKVVAHMGIINNGPGQMNTLLDPFTDYDGFIAIEIRGASSQLFPKKNYGFETQDSLGENNNVSLLGMPEENDWILHGPYADKSLLRNQIAYYLGRATGKYAPRTRLCEVMINSDYRGVYLLTEKIKQDANRVDIAKLKPEDIEGDELTGGYIVQIDRDDPSTNQDGFVSSFPDWKFWAYSDPDGDQIVVQQINYIRSYLNSFEETMDASNYASKFRNFVDVNSWVDYFLVTEIGKHIDAYKLSFFMHKKKDSNGGKLHFGPIWDFNLGFGNFNFDCPPDPEGWSYLFRGSCANWHPFWVSKLAEIPQVTHQANCRWQELRAGVFSTSNIMQYVDAQVALLQEPAARNFERWPVLGEYVWPNDFIGETWAEEISFLKFWLDARLNWMDQNMIGDCDLYVSGIDDLPKEDFVLFPNPSNGELFYKYSGNPGNSMELEIIDQSGRPLIVYPIDKSEGKLNLQELPKGMYLYDLRQEGVSVTGGKFIIE